jgi:hypothetical protein
MKRELLDHSDWDDLDHGLTTESEVVERVCRRTNFSALSYCYAIYSEIFFSKCCQATSNNTIHMHNTGVRIRFAFLYQVGQT